MKSSLTSVRIASEFALNSRHVWIMYDTAFRIPYCELKYI